MTSSEVAQELSYTNQLKADEHQTAMGHPWRRLLARSLDQTLYGLTWAVMQYFILRWHPPANFLTNLVDSYIMLAIMIVIEPALLTYTGTTPGKFIMGLEIRNTDGSRLSYKQGLSRMMGVFSKGLGYGIPFYSLVRCWKSSEATQNGETLEWDEGLSYQLKDTRPIRGWVMAAAYVIAVISVFWVIMQAQLPVNRGELTPETYAANINDMISRPIRQPLSRRMTDSGKWVASDESNRGTIHYDFDGPPPAHEIIVENGRVRGVNFEVRQTGADFWQTNYSQQKELMVMAFIGAQKGVNGYQLLFRSGLEDLLERQESYTHQIGGIKITNKVEHRGYDQAGSWLIPKEGEEQSYHLVFSLEKMD